MSDYQASVAFLPGKDGLVNLSHIAEDRVNAVSDYLTEGQMVKVKCLDVDQRGRIKLSIKEANPKAAEEAPVEAETAAEEPKTDG